MRVRAKVEGLDKVVANLNAEIANIKDASLKGLVYAALEISADAKKLTPVVTGNLRNSVFITSPSKVEEGLRPEFKDGPPGEYQRSGHAVRLLSEHIASLTGNIAECKAHGAEVHVGYSAFYSPIVHENPRAGNTGGVSPSGYIYPEGTYSTVGQWKFLQTAIQNNMGKLLSLIATFAGKPRRSRRKRK
jgi:hypothetical protein